MSEKLSPPAMVSNANISAMMPPTDRTTMRRKRERGTYDRAAIHAILDEALVGHVGFVAEHGPVVLPMVYARRGDVVYLHGAAGNDMLKRLAAGIPVCLTVTLIDGLVLARSAFHHSMNYRSVVVFGTGTRVADLSEIRDAADALVEHLVPGRSAEVRPPTDQEMRATLVIRLPITESSAKVRTGGPIEDPEDLGLPVWAGELPLALRAGAPVTDTQGLQVPLPPYLAGNRFAIQATAASVPSVVRSP
jgi:nitroimidazol reductase NimA-like FMN-containing flavoprotein (pyridoxamine 5'-phosphate oxidase superfamily)